MVSTVKKTTVLMQKMVAERMMSTRRTIVKEHGFNMEGSCGEGGFDTKGGDRSEQSYLLPC